MDNLTKEPTETELQLYSMLRENTGIELLDSGGAYGRHWQRNAKLSLQDFRDRPAVSFRPAVYGTRLELDVTLDLFHFLNDTVSYEKDMDELFHRYVDAKQKDFFEYWDDHWMVYNVNTHEHEDTGGHGYGDFSWPKAINSFVKWANQNDSKYHNKWQFDGEKFSGYTYNEENALSQDFTYRQAGEYIFIEIHGGCDARGGFTYPHIFTPKDDFSWMDYASYTIGCKNDHWWDYRSGWEDTEQPIKLKDCPGISYDEIDPEEIEALDTDMREYKAHARWYEKQPALFGEKVPLPPLPTLNMAGKVLVKDGVAHCPICGEPLEAWRY